MTFLVFIVIPAVLGGLAAGGVAYALAHRDVGRRRAAQIAVAAFLAWAVGWWLTGFVAAFAVGVGLVVYFVVRSRLRGVNALLVASGIYLVLTIGLGGMLYIGLSGMG